MAFGSAGYNGTVGALTLSANSILDLGTSDNGVILHFGSINWSDTNALLAIQLDRHNPMAGRQRQ
jgi:hypothetical protein